MAVLVIAEHNNKALLPSTAILIGAASEFKSPIHLVILGCECEKVVEQARGFSSLEKILWFDSPRLKDFLAEPMSECILDIAENYQVVLAPANTFGKNLLPRISARLGVAQISEVTEILSPTQFEHPIYAGNAIETVESCDPIQLLTIRLSAFLPAKQSEDKHVLVSREKKTTFHTQAFSQFIERAAQKSSRPPLQEARVVVSGGRGLQTAENFCLIEQLADCLNGAVGATRAAVDAGFISNAHQVGQTGKVVAPELYIAIGISGAIQHVSGIKDSKVIVAINKDPDAPIFEIADYGLVGDLFEIVPQLLALLKS